MRRKKNKHPPINIAWLHIAKRSILQRIYRYVCLDFLKYNRLLEIPKLMQIMFYEAFKEEELALKRYLPDELTAGFTWKTVQEFDVSQPGAKIISVRTQSQIPPAWADRVDAILTRSTGYDHILKFRKASQKDISCGYLPLYCKRSVAEQAMMLWMCLLRKLFRQVGQFSDFNRDGLTGGECSGKTLVVVGVGHIGYEIAMLGNALGMTVIGVDIEQKHADITYESIDSAIVKADIVACAMNLTDKNAGYFDHALFSRAKAGVLFVNVARGEMMRTGDLVQLLDEGRLGGVGLDVFENESEIGVAFRQHKRDNSSPRVIALRELATRDNVILTPHNAFNTVESVERKSEQSIQQIVQFIKKSEFIWQVPQVNPV